MNWFSTCFRSHVFFFRIQANIMVAFSFSIDRPCCGGLDRIFDFTTKKPDQTKKILCVHCSANKNSFQLKRDDDDSTDSKHTKCCVQLK